MDQRANIELISVAQAARILGVSDDRVRQLDPFLQPDRVCGRRIYDRARVEWCAGFRAAARCMRGIK